MGKGKKSMRVGVPAADDRVSACRSHTGRTVEEFEPTAQTIRNWAAQAEIDDGRGDGLSTAERDELRKLRRENKRLRQEREILAKAAAWFAQEADTVAPKSSGS